VHCSTLRPAIAAAALLASTFVVPAQANFLQTNLVSDGFVPAPIVDPNLVNPWGISHSQTSPFWISDNGMGLSTLYRANGAIVPLVVTIPPPLGSPAGTKATPTGQVFNTGGTNDFVVSSGGKSGRAAFIFATEDGTISGWSPTVALTHAVIAVDNPAGDAGPVYKGLAIANNGGSNFLYAANFRSGNVDVFNNAFHNVGSFRDMTVPSDYAPFNVQTLNGNLFVTYAEQDAAKHDDVAGAGHGFVDEFDLSGNFIKRIASSGPLNSPWALDIAPAHFGQFSNDLLVGNFGDGTIDVFDPSTNAFLGMLPDINDATLSIDGLWALTNGNNGVGSDPNSVYFTAGTDDEHHGLFGKLTSVPEPGSIALALAGLIGMLAFGRRRSPFGF
jgi:uncharacterized protein (TIGR03118 family)